MDVSIQLHNSKESLEVISMTATSPSRDGKRRYEDSCRTDSFDDDSTDSLHRDSSNSIHRNESLNKMIDFLNDMESKSNKRMTRNRSTTYSLSFCRDDDEIRVGAKIVSTVTAKDARMKRAKTFDNLVLLESSIILESIDVGAIYL